MQKSRKWDEFVQAHDETEHDEEFFHLNFINMKEMEFPQRNPINLEFKGNKLCTYLYPSCHPEGEKKGRIIYFHGFSEYGGRYAFFFKQMAEQGYDVYTMDQMGFGRSFGKRSYWPEGTDGVDMYREFVE
jgi:alpha-beta hydrolase superfamily lysophospholipase